jgi:hypothetical protein
MHGYTGVSDATVHQDDQFCLTYTGNRKTENGILLLLLLLLNNIIKLNTKPNTKTQTQTQSAIAANALRECKMKAVSVQNMKT